MTFIKLALNAACFVRIFNPYRPELHYMRGPGPKWHARHAAVPNSSPALRDAAPVRSTIAEARA